MTDALVDQFLESYDESRFPPDLLREFELLECLAQNEFCETLLAKEKNSGALCVAKCTNKQAGTASGSEDVFLQELKHTGLPGFISKFENEHMTCVVRTYAAGQALDRRMQDHAFTHEESLAITLQLCDILSLLHHHRPPIIHRDIKPQNVILDASGQVTLIDFGISRTYDESAHTDTQHWGTRHFAAPEQYGFSQTDARTDIYALGVLLGWMLTKETDIALALPKIRDGRVQRVIRKCTSFSPVDRYASVEKVKAALEVSAHPKLSPLLRWSIRGFTALALLICGFVIGRYTSFASNMTSTAPVHFKEALIEKAVRVELEMDETAVITRQDLLRVTEINIYGSQVAASRGELEQFNNAMTSNDPSVRDGGIKSLVDLSMMPNLDQLSIINQQISDLTPLANLSRLESLQIKHNPIMDVTPLGRVTSLRELTLFDTRVSDLSPLAGCLRLETLEIGKSDVISFSSVPDLPFLTRLSFYGSRVASLTGVEKLSGLQYLSFLDLADGDFSPLFELPNLREVHLDRNLSTEPRRRLDSAPFTVIYDQ